MSTYKRYHLNNETFLSDVLLNYGVSNDKEKRRYL